MKFKRHIFAVLLIIVVGTMIWLRPRNTYRPRTFEEIKADGVLRIVTDYTPLSYYLQGDSLSGFDYELARMVGNRSGLSIEITPEVNLSKSIDGLKKGQYDINVRNQGRIGFYHTHSTEQTSIGSKKRSKSAKKTDKKPTRFGRKNSIHRQ